MNLHGSFLLMGSFIGIAMMITTYSFHAILTLLARNFFMKLAKVENFLDSSSCLSLDRCESTSSSFSMHGPVRFSIDFALLDSVMS